MKKLIATAVLAASGLFAACEHGAPQPGPREVRAAPMGAAEPTPVATSPEPMRTVTPVVPGDAGTPLPNTTPPTTTGAINAGPSAMLETQRNLHSDDDLHLLPPAQRMPITNIPAQPMPAGPMPSQPEPSSVKPDGGILFDGGAPLPPIPDGGPLPQTRDASVPL
jgi:hypothetical protein